MFRGVFALNTTCPHCGVRFDRYAGEWLGPTLLAYGAAASLTAVLGVLLVRRFGFFPGLSFVLVPVSVCLALAVYRPAKGWWTWLIWTAGLVVTDEEAEREEP